MTLCFSTLSSSPNSRIQQCNNYMKAYMSCTFDMPLCLGFITVCTGLKKNIEIPLTVNEAYVLSLLLYSKATTINYQSLLDTALCWSIFWHRWSHYFFQFVASCFSFFYGRHQIKTWNNETAMQTAGVATKE